MPGEQPIVQVRVKGEFVPVDSVNSEAATVSNVASASGSGSVSHFPISAPAGAGSAQTSTVPGPVTVATPATTAPAPTATATVAKPSSAQCAAHMPVKVC
ncbi:hypothetical protein KIPB_015048 [Kipferlia bialata]|uniref:Uncharacterized protein n=1 Tax=Kipferlia bialata TaxID=797122 RepID=A0A391PBF6_9EUKA|nr:hypothetical protein KIPB_015048 [Kipferlia bialata]|eukprot:g15048.t1